MLPPDITVVVILGRVELEALEEEDELDNNLDSEGVDDDELVAIAVLFDVLLGELDPVEEELPIGAVLEERGPGLLALLADAETAGKRTVEWL